MPADFLRAADGLARVARRGRLARRRSRRVAARRRDAPARRLRARSRARSTSARDFAGAAQRGERADVHRALRRRRRRAPRRAGGLTRWRCCRSPNPASRPTRTSGAIAVGIDLGTTHSLVAAVRSGVAECLPDRDGEVILPSAVRYFADGRREIGREALAGAVERPDQHHRLGQALHGARPRRRRAARAARLRLRRRAGHGPRADGGRDQVAGRGLGRDPRDPAPARRGHLRRRALRRRHHRAGVLRRRPAPGDQGRRRARRPERAAPDQRADRGGDRLRPRQRAAKACTRSTTSAAAPSTSRCCA